MREKVKAVERFTKPEMKRVKNKRARVSCQRERERERESRRKRT